MAFPDSLTTPDRRGTGSFKWDGAGPDEIPMWVADMDFAVAPEIVAAITRRLDHPVFGYSGVPDSFREALVAWEQQRNDWEIDPRHMVVVPSVMPAIAVAIEALTRPGDRVITFSPVYHPFFEVVEGLGRTLVRVALAEETAPDGGTRYVMDTAALAGELEGTALLLLCSPHNPGGRVWSRVELAALRELVSRAGVPVVSDEIHSDLIFPGERFTPWLTVGPPGDRDMALVAPSKTFNIPGLPIATAVIPGAEWRRAYRQALNVRMLRLPNLLAVTAAEAAYREGATWLDTVRGQIRHNYDILRTELAAERGVSVHSMEGTFIAWIDFRDRWHAAAASDLAPGDEASRSVAFGELARTHGVWLSDGRQFGPEGEGFMRINVATSEERLREGIARVRRALGDFDGSM
jgi:cysteine-S-conjugate beta-lyase